jgi:hypothetical protein
MDKKKIVFFCVLLLSFVLFLIVFIVLSMRHQSSEYYIQNNDDNDDDLSPIIEKFLSHYRRTRHHSPSHPFTERSYVVIKMVRVNTELTRVQLRLRDARVLGFSSKTPIDFVLSYLPTKKIVYVDDFETTSPVLSQQIEDSHIFDCPLFFL